MLNLTAVLFDLDGTLIDPAEGITRSIDYALTALEHPSVEHATLLTWIGPPLRGSFATQLATDDPALIERAMALYRERYADQGLAEHAVYPGVAAMLSALRALPVRVILATSKPHVFARRILAYLELDQFFDGIYGSELDGRFDHKGELLEHLLTQEQLATTNVIMVGDRRHDIEAAHQHGIQAIGVTYGYGSLDELRTARADWLCDSPEAVLEQVQQLKAA